MGGASAGDDGHGCRQSSFIRLYTGNPPVLHCQSGHADAELHCYLAFRQVVLKSSHDVTGVVGGGIDFAIRFGLTFDSVTPQESQQIITEEPVKGVIKKAAVRAKLLDEAIHVQAV